MRLIDADAMREDWLENGENEHVYDTNAILASIDEQPTIEAVPVEVINRVVMDLNKKERECSERRAAYYSEDKKYRAYIQLGKAEAYRDVIDMLGKKV